MTLSPRTLAIQKGKRLVDIESRETLYYGQRVTTFDGVLGVLEWAEPPAADRPAGRVFVLQHNAGFQNSWLPSVIGAEWIDA